MFGYIRPWAPELRVKEQEAYRAVYCGLCKTLGRQYGPLLRLSLSYDFAFLSILALAVTGEEPQFCQERCVVHPLRQRNCCRQNRALERSAAIATLLLYHKLQDDLADGDAGEKARSYGALPFVKGAYEKAAAQLPQLAQLIGEQMEEQAALEREHCASTDRASEPSAKILEAVLEELSEEPGQRRVLGRIGYLLGRWVYLMDALDDLEEDQRRDNYNPFRYTTSGEESPQEDAVASLYITIGELNVAWQLLDVTAFEGILDNVFALGLKNSVDQLKKKHQLA